MASEEIRLYLPARFKTENESEIFSLVCENPLATVISVRDARPFVSHLPLVLEKDGEKIKLIGHLACANPHSRLMEGPVTAIFHGPQAYITPRWYAENDVPTWNYAVVHFEGVGRLLRGYDETVACLERLTAHVEANAKTSWEFWLPEDLATPEKLTSAIAGFEIDVTEIKAKFKLNQNRSVADQSAVVEGLLREREDSNSHRVANLMKRLCLKEDET